MAYFDMFNCFGNESLKFPKQRAYPTCNAKRKAQRQQWIEALQKGENPFTPEVLEGLK
jgi:hypothetical protein